MANGVVVPDRLHECHVCGQRYASAQEALDCARRHNDEGMTVGVILRTVVTDAQGPPAGWDATYTFDVWP